MKEAVPGNHIAAFHSFIDQHGKSYKKGRPRPRPPHPRFCFLVHRVPPKGVLCLDDPQPSADRHARVLQALDHF